MKVSIIIPVYNAEKYLGECIDSALKQTYQNIEVIAIDDGSTDNSHRILENFGDKIKIISKKNGGTATALNEGIRNMTGEWFKWLSADDVLYPNAVEDLIKEVKKISNRKVILYANYDIINSEGKTVKQFIEPNNNQLSMFEKNVLLLDHHIGNGTTSLIHKSAFEKYGMFDETIGYAEDYEFWLRLCLINEYNLHLVSKILAKYRIHEAQLTQSKIGKSLEKAEKIRNMVLEKLDPDQQKKYRKAVRELRDSKPLQIKIRHKVRNVMFRVLPKSISERIVRKYFDKIKKDQ